MTLEHHVKFDMMSAADNLELLHYLTSRIADPFLSPDLVDRMASMLNYFLDHLVSKKCTDLKVQNMEKYHFDPRKLVGFIIDVYLHLKSDKLAKAIANEGRSYSHENFLAAADVIARTGIRTEVGKDNLCFSIFLYILIIIISA
jgi:ubiquitin conjugation factor E4 B